MQGSDCSSDASAEIQQQAAAAQQCMNVDVQYSMQRHKQMSSWLAPSNAQSKA
jgi:hypothetical protein